ncbi:MAG TPA: regulatory protein RecX [Gammaproteobacteria bacterium]|nr:regulatory protein RecX [Gammaproteobacteria bacterium]
MSTYEAAITLLARREHSRLELGRKLEQKGHDPDVVTEALDTAEAEGLLSDERFAESYARARREKGYGPLRIRAELRERGVAAELAAQGMEALDEDWPSLAEAVRQKRFGGDKPREAKERARQSRFLQYRGFEADLVRRLLNED